ncbi:hypothetical protein CSHISOI_11154, partial [Colletotrichum shisoi]
MWDILFPGMTRPSSPYVDDEATVSTLSIDEITRQHTTEKSVDTAETKTKKEVPGTKSDATTNTQTIANNLESPSVFESPQVDSTDFDDLDSESEDDSIFSLAESLLSMTSAGSISVIENGYLVKEFANLIRKDKVMMALARSLKGEAKSSEHSVAATFVSQFSDKISSDLFSSLPTEEKKVLGNLADQEGSVDRRQKVEEFLRCRVVMEQQQDESLGNEDGIEDENEEADANEDELYDGSLSELRHITRFLVDSLAFQTLRQRLQDFVHPSMTTELRGVLSAWLKPGSKRAKLIRQYELRNLITELQFVPTSQIWLERKHDYQLAQIGVEPLKCHQFFRDLKARYGGLRGYVRMWFSVWVYSHCDFYMCEKFEDHEFVPKKEHEFPEAFNLDYDFIPKPAERETMPPVTPHEFYRRFHACYDRTSALHFHPHCRKLSGHSGDILDKFPKKRSELEGGDARVVFWGIYARERIAMVRVLCYNFVCVLPMLVFFF